MASGKSSSSIWLVLHLSPRKRGSLEEQVLALAKRMAARGALATVPSTSADRRAPSATVRARAARFCARAYIMVVGARSLYASPRKARASGSGGRTISRDARPMRA